MPPLIPVLVALGVGGVYYYLRSRTAASSGSAMDFAAVDSTRPPGTTVVVPVPGQSTGEMIMTSATSTEQPVRLVVLAATTHPRMPSQADQVEARTVALQLESLLRTNPDGGNYTTKNKTLLDLVKRFQRLCSLETDGLYGPVTAGALMFFLGGRPPPPPLFYPGAPPGRHIRRYEPK